jgi:hypothetical protein
MSRLASYRVRWQGETKVTEPAGQGRQRDALPRHAVYDAVGNLLA